MKKKEMKKDELFEEFEKYSLIDEAKAKLFGGTNPTQDTTTYGNVWLDCPDPIVPPVTIKPYT